MDYGLYSLLTLLYNIRMDTQPFFSVIVPTFNRAHFLHKCLDSVIGQSYKNFEIVIVDDGSTDGTEELISSLRDKRIRYLYQENCGVAAARNKALGSASGDHIAFLDSDDWWTTDKLKKTVEYIHGFPKIKVFHTEEVWHKCGRPLMQRPKHKKPTGFVYTSALALCCISISTAVIHKNILDEIGLFDESFEACEDYDLWLRITNRYEVKLIPEALTLKDGGRPDQLSSNVWGLDRFRIKALEKMLSSGTLSREKYDLTLLELNKKCSIFAAGSKKRGKNDDMSYYLRLSEKYTRPSGPQL